MAATLMAIKSKTLLPIQEVSNDEEEFWEEDPRDELVNPAVRIHRKFKYAAEEDMKRQEERSLYFTKRTFCNR